MQPITSDGGGILLPLYLYRFIRLDFVTFNLVVILDYTIIILGEYFVDVEYATGYFRQPKDYLIREGEDMYPDLRIAHEEKTGAYPLKQSYAGISYGKEWKYRIGYLDLFRYSPEEYYVGPTITIYGK